MALKTVSIHGNDYVYYYDTHVGVWLSLHEKVVLVGLNGTSVSNTFLSHLTANLGTTLGREVISPNVKSRLVWVTAAAQNVPNAPLEVHSISTVKWSTTWNSQFQRWTPDVSFTAGEFYVSVKIGTATTAIIRPVVMLGFRWED